MPIVAPTLITPYGPPPNSSDPLNFDARADAKVAHDAVVVTQTNELATNVYENALEAQGSAVAALSSELAAANSASVAVGAAGAPVWSAVTFYGAGDPAWSPLSGLSYRRKTPGSGGSDPSLAPATWAPVGSGGLQMVTEAGATATVAANTDVLMTRAGQWAATAPPAPAEGDRIELEWENTRLDNTLDLGSNSIKGRTSNATGVVALNLPLNRIRLRWRAGFWRNY
ncbi:hypothetical protein LNV47_18080 [Paucibacter sp. DJ4R-1]|nr:hypothetical protein [Paucibacter sp. DJ4R-1]